MRRSGSLAVTALGALALCAAQASATEFTSVYSGVKRNDCVYLNSWLPPSLPYDGEAPVPCQNFQGYGVAYAYSGSVLSFRVRMPGVTDAADRLRVGYDYGGRVEWRGRRRSGVFKPHAAIVRLIWTRETGVKVHALGILRVEAGAVCGAALVDADANRNANALARAAADEAALRFQCGRDAPVLRGAAGAAVREALVLFR